MKIGFIGGLAAVAGLVVLAAVAGILVVKYTSSGSETRSQSESTATEQAAPAPAPSAGTAPPSSVPAPAIAVTTNPVTGAPQFVRSCAGTYVEAVNLGVLPNFAQLSAAPPQTGKQGEMICFANTPSSHYEIAYFSSCADGGDSCPVLAHVTQEGKYVVFHRD